MPEDLSICLRMFLRQKEKWYQKETWLSGMERRLTEMVNVCINIIDYWVLQNIFDSWKQKSLSDVVFSGWGTIYDIYGPLEDIKH